MKSAWHDEFKVVLMGPLGAGKSYLLGAWIKQKFPDDCEMTEVPVCTSRLVSAAGREVRLNVWDTANMEKFKSLTETYSRNAAAILVVYDSSNPDSLQQAQTIFLHEQDRKAKETLLYFVANKIDEALPELLADGKTFAEANHGIFYEVSAMMNVNVLQLFDDVIESVDRIGFCERVPGHKSTTRLEPVMEEYVSPCCL